MFDFLFLLSDSHYCYGFLTIDNFCKWLKHVYLCATVGTEVIPLTDLFLVNVRHVPGNVTDLLKIGSHVTPACSNDSTFLQSFLECISKLK